MILRTCAGLVLAALAAGAQPCVTAAPACTEWLSYPAGPERSLFYRTYPLDKANPALTRALVVVHGAGRNADHYFSTAAAAAFLANALQDTEVISIRLASNQAPCQDALAANEVSWNCESWRSGGIAANSDRVNSFEFVDGVLRKLARKGVFPNLRSIVVAGFSAGGQYVNRYAMSNTVHDKLGVPVSYVVGSPSSYAYPEPLRPNADGSVFRPFPDARNCTAYDRWPYGFNNRSGYSAALTDEQIRTQLVSRPVTYLLGGLDTLPLFGFDSSCPAMAQGPTRLARGEAYFKLVTEKYGAAHKKIVIPNCGHNDRCMFTSETALPALFK